MIPTPLYSENPKGWTRAENFDEGDGIPIEKGSGFGNHITRDVMTASIVISYIEITASTTVDVSARYSDLHLRVVGSGEGIVTTVTGQLPQGRRLHMDVQAAANASTLIIGGETYELPAGGGVLTFVSTSDGWSAPLKLDFDLRIANDLTVDGAANFVGASNFLGGIHPNVRSQDDFILEYTSLASGASMLVPVGVHLIRSLSGGPITIDVHVHIPAGPGHALLFTWIDFSEGALTNVVPSDGVNYRIRNTSSSTTATFGIIKL